MKIILNDNEFVTEAALTAYDAIKEAGLMTREVIAALLDGETVALTAPITEGCRLAPLTFADKEGKSKAGRGAYPRAKPFFTMKFDTPKSALLILLDIGDMFDMTANSQLIMEGGPEFGVQIGDMMMHVGGYAK